MKGIALALFLFLVLNSIYAMDGDIGISSGHLCIGLNSETLFTDYFIYGRLLNFMYQPEFGLGISASPVVFTSNVIHTDNFMITFVNVSIFYNFFKKSRENLLLGPFISINAVNYNNPQFFELRSGLIFLLRNLSFDDTDSEKSMFDLDLLNIEFGYKYNQIYKHRFYAQIGIDLICAVGFLVTRKEKDYENYQKDNPKYWHF